MISIEKAAIVIHTHGRPRTAPHPSRTSASSVVAATASPRRCGRIGIRNAAETANVAASTAKAQPPPTPITSTVASAGPTKPETVSTSPVAALAGWSCSGGTVCGISPV